MVRAGLGPQWQCLFANDFDHKKSRIYRENWGDAELKTADVASLTLDDLPGLAHLAWASFPCQDLSLAGGGAGLKGERSGTYRPFWALMKSLIAGGRPPQIIAIENVCGTLTSHGGKDFVTICRGFVEAGYSVGAMVIDAVRFVPQSRPRLFVIGIREGVSIPDNVVSPAPLLHWHTKGLQTAYAKLSASVRNKWIWWNLPLPDTRTLTLSDVVEDSPLATEWFSDAETEQLLAMMSDLNRTKLEEAQQIGRRIVGGVYKRTRRDEFGGRLQRAEIRFDDIAGCLRTPIGGSSRQVVVAVNGPVVRARLISSRETARLMGLPDSYILPVNYNEAYHLTGDGVVVPVVRHLAEHIFEPILNCEKQHQSIAA